MTKRPLSPAAQAAASLAALLTVLPASAQGSPVGQSGACVACLSIAVDANTTDSLPGQLEGLEVFVRVSAGREAAAWPSLAEIERKGGRPALLLSGMPGPLAPGVGELVRRIVIDLPAQPADQSDEVFSFSLKTSLTALRAAIPGSTAIGLAAGAARWQSLLSRDLGSYVDFVVVNDAQPLAQTGIELWQLTSAPSTVAAAISTTTTGATHVIWSLPADTTLAAALVSELARSLALPATADPQQPQAADRFAQDVQVIGSRSL